MGIVTARRALLGVLTLALLVRGAGLVEYSTLPFFTHHRLDALLYHDAALRFAAGDWAMGPGVLHMSPAFSAFLGLQYWAFGAGPWIPRVVNLALGLAVVAAIFDVTRVLFGDRWATVAGLVSALYGPFAFYGQQVHVSAFATAVNAALVWAAIRSVGTRRRWTWAAAVGGLWGLAIVTRPNALLFAIPLGYLAVLRVRSEPRGVGLREVALAGGLAAAIVAPVTVRNLVVGGEPVLVTDSGGLNFFIGNGPGADGTFRIPPEVPGGTSAQRQFDAFRAVAEAAQGRPLSSRELDGYWYGRTLEHMRGQPGTWLGLMGRKAWLFWHAEELSNTHDYGFHRELMGTAALVPIGFGWITGLAALGTGLLVWDRRPAARTLGLLNLVGFAALVAFFVLGHYRATFVAGLIVAAVAGTRALLAWGRAREWGKILPAGLGLVLWTASMHVPVFEHDFSEEYRKLGYAHHVQGELPQAAIAYAKALEIRADNRSAHKNLAILLATVGDLEGARGHWMRVRALAEQSGAADARLEAEEALRRLPPPGSG